MCCFAVSSADRFRTLAEEWSSSNTSDAFKASIDGTR